MKKYKILSKVILTVCLCGIILAIVNGFTRIINSSVKVSGTVISILGFLVAGNTTILLENERMKKRERINKQIVKETIGVGVNEK